MVLLGGCARVGGGAVIHPVPGVGEGLPHGFQVVFGAAALGVAAVAPAQQ
ncbi:MAG: hypothetical protein U1U88_001584 [Lawsonella clevelandensis]